MGSQLSAPGDEAASPEAPPEAPPEWLTVLQHCSTSSSSKVELAVWEDGEGGSSVHSGWSAQLSIIPIQAAGVVRSLLSRAPAVLSSYWSQELSVTTVRLTRLDPVTVFSGLNRVEEWDLERWCKRTHSRLERLPWLRGRDYEGAASLKRPWTLSGRSAEWSRDQLDLRPSNYRLRRVVNDTHNLVLEFEGGPMLLWRWAVKQLELAEGVRELLWSMVRSSQDVDHRWVYVFMQGYRFHGRLPGMDITRWSRDH